MKTARTIQAAVAIKAHVNNPASLQNEALLRGEPESFRRPPKSAVSSSAARSSECIEESLLLFANKGSAGAMVEVELRSIQTVRSYEY